MPVDETLHQWWTARSPADALTTKRLLRSRAVARGLRIAITLPATMATLIHLGHGQAAFLASFALISLLVIADFSGPRRERFWSIITVTGIGSVTLIAGGLISDFAVIKVVAALVLGITVTLVAAIRGFLGKATIPILLPFFIATTSVSTIGQLPQMLAGWLIGGTIAAVAAVTLWPFFPRAVITEAVTDAIDAEADAVSAYWELEPTDPQEAWNRVDASIGRVHELYLGQRSRPGSAYRRERFLLRLIEEVRRFRVSLRLGLRRLPFEPSPADRSLAATTAASLHQAAQSLREENADLESFARLEQARVGHRISTEQIIKTAYTAGDAQRIIDVATSSYRPRAISLQALGLTRDVAGAASLKDLPPVQVRGQSLPNVVAPITPERMLRAQLAWRAPWMRNAVRFGLALAMATAVVQFVGLNRGYWVVLGTVSVLRIDFGGTQRVAFQVLVGQVLGFGAALALIAVAGQESSLFAWALLPVLAAIQGYVAGNAPIAVQQISFTMLLINLVLVTTAADGVPLLRLEDVLIGAAVALLASALVFPRGLIPQVETVLRGASVSALELLRRSVRGDDVKALQQHTARMLVRAENTVDLALAQGVGRGARTELWLRILGSAEYVTFVADVLAVTSDRSEWPTAAQRCGGDVIAAGMAVADRLEVSAEQLIDNSDVAGGIDTLPDFAGIANFSAAVQHAVASVDAQVTAWAQQRTDEYAGVTLQLYWSLGWLAEIDLMSANGKALARAIRTSAMPESPVGVGGGPTS